MVENKLEEGTKDIQLRNEKRPISKASQRNGTQRLHTSASGLIGRQATSVPGLAR